MTRRYLLHFSSLALLAAGLLCGPAAGAQVPAAPAPPKNIIKIAPLGWIHGQLPFSVESRIGYERVLGQRSSLMGSASYLGTNYPFSFIGSFALSSAISSAFTLEGHPAVVWTETRIRTSGYRYQLQYRYYLSRRRTAPEGWYLAPHVSYAQADYDIRLKDFDVGVSMKIKNANANLLVGYQKILGRHFTVDAFTGLGYRDRTIRVFDSRGTLVDTDSKNTPLKLSSGLNVGWAW